MVWMILAFGRIRRIRPMLRKLLGNLSTIRTFRRPQERQAGKIGLANSPQGSAIESGNALRIMEPADRRRSIHCGRRSKIRQFAGAVNLRMAGEDLLDQSAAGTRHAKHENRHWMKDRLLPGSDRTGCVEYGIEIRWKSSPTPVRRNGFAGVSGRCPAQMFKGP
jgi:hypothetical protein